MGKTWLFCQNQPKRGYKWLWNSLESHKKMADSNHDNISKEVLKTITESPEPLETKEIEEAVKKKIHGLTRTKLFYRLMILRGENLIWGKFVGPGKGVWIWWKKCKKDKK